MERGSDGEQQRRAPRPRFSFHAIDGARSVMHRLRYRAKTSPSRLESKFELLWRSLGGPELEREYRFHPTRKWRADFAHVATRTLVEIEGGIYVHGRHNRAAGFVADTEKYLEAFLAGWSVVRLTAPQITAPTIERLIRRVTGQASA